jgi:hypothetical protein
MRGRGYAEERLQKLQVARDCPSIVRDAMLVLQVGQSPPPPRPAVTAQALQALERVQGLGSHGSR